MADSPHVAIIGTRGYPSYYGGFETAVRKLAPYLVDNGWRVTVYGRPGGVQVGAAERDRRVDSVITKGLETKSLSTLSYGLTASLHASRRRPDVALVMNVANGYWLPFLQRSGIPTVVNVDGIEWDRAKWGRAAKAAFRTGARLTARYASELVMDAHAINARWEQDFGRGGVFLPYGGEIRPHQDAPLGLETGSFALMVARLVPENSVNEFFDAVPTIAAEHPVVIVGTSGYGGDLDARAAQLAATSPNVTWLGHVADDHLLHSLWQNCGAYFHGHTVGGTNPALVQAMACGAPVVAIDTVYNAEVLGDREQLVGRDVDGIVKNVTELISDRAGQAALRAKNQVRAADTYAWDQICAGYANVLTGAMHTIPRGRRKQGNY